MKSFFASSLVGIFIIENRIEFTFCLEKIVVYTNVLLL